MQRDFYKFKSEEKKNLFLKIEQSLIKILDVDNLPDNVYWKYRKCYKEGVIASYSEIMSLDPYEVMLIELTKNERYLKSIVDTKDFNTVYSCGSYIYTVIVNKIKEQYKVILSQKNEYKKKNEELERLINLDIEDKSTKIKYKNRSKKVSPELLRKYWE